MSKKRISILSAELRTAWSARHSVCNVDDYYSVIRQNNEFPAKAIMVGVMKATVRYARLTLTGQARERILRAVRLDVPSV